MKTRIILLVLSMMLAVTMQAQSYDQLWKRVEQMEQKDLPKSVIAEAQEIYQKAKNERDVPQMMKAYLTIMAYRESISPDSLVVDVKGLEEWADSPQTEVPDRAVLYSVLGEITIKDDFEKGNGYLHLSLKDSMNLVDYPAEKLVPMVETGETSRLYFDNNLYDLLARRAIRLWNENQWNAQREAVLETVRQTYQSLLYIYKVKGMRSAWLLTALDAYPQADEEQLREWMKEYADLDVSAEVYLRLAKRMIGEDKPAQRLALLQEGIKRYPNYNRINALKNEEMEILLPQLRFSVGYTYPGEPVMLQLHYRNLTGFTIRFYRINLPAESPLLTKISPKNVAQYGKFLYDTKVGIPSTPDYRMQTMPIKVPPLEAGIYYAVAIPEGYKDIVRGALLHVTGLQAIYRTFPDERLEMVILDKRSGHPVANAQVDIYEEKDDRYERKEVHTADAEGVLVLKRGKTPFLSFQARTTADTSMPVTRIWLGNNRHYKVSDKTMEYVNLFTDRSLYRPGQTLCFSGIVYSQRKDDVHAKEGWVQMVNLLDVDGQEVAKCEVKTDAFGTFQGTFELPKYGKAGVYRLQTDKGMTTFRVEEYKRPTFEVTFDTVRTSYQAGDSIGVTGMARTFTGVPVQGAKVKYAVTRLENNSWRMLGIATHRMTGETMTDADGCFEVPVHFLPIQEGIRSWRYIYEVSADVTNLAGETQDGILNLPLGSSSLKLLIPDWEGITLVKEEHFKEVTFQVSNLMNMPIEKEVDYQILSGDKVVLQGKALSNRSFVLEGMDALPSGRYQLKASVKDERGNVVEQVVSFSVLSLKDKRLSEGTGIWCYQQSKEFDAGGQATIYFGSSDKDVCLFYDVAYGENRIEQKRIQFSDSLMVFRYTYKEEYGDGLRCYFTYMKNGKLHIRDLYIRKPKPDKALQLKWKTFRDKLQPGQQEIWTLSILRPDGKPADAQLLATMYDASLDQLASHDWRFGLTFTRKFPNIAWGQMGERNVYWGFLFPRKTLDYSPLIYSDLDVPFKQNRRGGGLLMYKANTATTGTVVELKYTPPAAMDAVSEEALVEETGNVQIRTDFAETAFFYPQLRTDVYGEVNIEFTLPESLTEWKFMGLAHTRDMDYGSIVAKAIASKDFMLQPNLPRFVRVGDEVNIAASLVNVSGKDIQGTVWLELFIPETEKVILKQKRPFAVKASETSQVSFGFEVSDKYEGLAVRMVADGGSFSDGEQRYLPVLSNKQKLTESVLLNVNGKGTYTFSLESLFNHHSKTVSRPQMKVEFTGNPLWYAIQALKIMENPETDNALSWASAYYANALLTHLAKTEPRIADSLKVEGVEARISEAVLKLKDLQNKEGAWSWFKGMSGSRYMTTEIIVQLARLQQMTTGLADAEVIQMYRQAWRYLGKEVSEEVQRMKEQEKEGLKNLLPSEQAIQYLYIGALDKNLVVPFEIKEYLLDKLTESTRVLTVYGKALVAIIMQQANQMPVANEILQSVMEYSVMTPEMGRYFDTPKAEYSWFSYKIPTQVAAIEAFHRMKKNTDVIEEMKLWLLKQKQAQDWDTPVATLDAVYALLLTGKDWLQYSGVAEIKVGKEIIRTPDNALGYVEKEVPGKVMNIKQVTVEKTTDGIGWGAVYAEFEEDLDKVISQGNALKVNHTLYKDGKLVPENAMLQVGDKLTVRLTVTADRDMDFVQVKDERAACMEPVDALSGYRWNRRIGYYQEIRDASTSFYLDQMRKGTYELEYEVYITSSGRYVQGVATVQSVYAPEFVGHGTSCVLIVE